MGSDAEAGHAPQGSPKGGSRWSPAWLQRVNTTLILVILIGAVGFGVRTLAKHYAGEVSVPGIYVRVRPERGGTVEARALPGAGGWGPGVGEARISMDVTLVDVASLARLIEEVSRVRVVLPCPVERRVSLRVRDAPVENVLEAVAAAANLQLLSRDGSFVLSACAPETR